MINFVKRFAPLLVFFAAMLWATDAPFRSHLTKDLSSNFIVLVEHFLNLIFVIPLLVVSWKSIKTLSKKDWIFVAFVGIGGSALASVAFTESFSYMNPSVSILLQKLQPFIAIGLASIFLRERLSKRFWLWATVAIFGAYLISFPNLIPTVYEGEVWNPHVTGVFLALLAAALWGASTVFGKRILNKVSFEAMTGLRFATAFIFLFILNLSTGSLSEVNNVTYTDMLFLIIVSLVSGAMSLLLYYRGLQVTKASIATIAELGFVFAALLINIVFLDATLAFGQVVGILILLLAVLSLTKGDK